MKLILLACLVACAFGAPQPMSTQYERLFSPMNIVGGKPATLGQFPHQVSYQVLSSGSYRHFCGGSIVAADTIITAAHCLQHGVADRNTRIVAGITKLNDASGGQTIQVARSIYHPNFSMSGNIVNDIGILKLSQPLQLNNNVKVIKVATSGDTPSSTAGKCTASGWGNSVIGGSSSNDLQYVNINFISDTECRRSWSGVATVFPEQNICAGTPRGGESVCQGDSGGPLICALQGNDNGEQILFGATSWGSGWQCGAAGYPAVWSEIPYFRTWLQTEAGITLP